MTKKEILAMGTGRELDKLVATEVMGEPIPDFTPENALDLQLAGSPVKSPQGNWLCLCEYAKGDIPIWRPLPYSTDISAAWKVVKEVAVSPIMFTLLMGFHPAPWAIAHFGEYEGGGDTAPEAICKAALLAICSQKR